MLPADVVKALSQPDRPNEVLSALDEIQRALQGAEGNRILRDILPNEIRPLLIHLLSDRLVPEMPATFDDEANEAAIAGEAMTLSRKCLKAASAYATILNIPGALGAGWVEIAGISALDTVLRRWKVECCIGQKKTARSSNNKDHSLSQATLGDDAMDVDETFDDGYNNIIVIEEPDDMAFEEMIGEGLKISKHFCAIPMQKEFGSWSQDARETVAGTISMCLTVAGALCSNEIVSLATESLKQTLCSPKQDEESVTFGDSNQANQHATTISMLRGLYQALAIMETFPNGEKGKEAAALAASRALVAVMGAVSAKESSSSSNSNLKNHLSSPMGNVLTPKKTTNRRQSSSGRSEGGRTPAKLKSRPTPQACKTPSMKPRPVFGAFLGVLQKIATCKHLDRTIARRPVVETLLEAIPMLPSQERFKYIQFVQQLCHSKITTNRIVAVEVLGGLVISDWLWKEHENCFPAGEADVFSPLGSISPFTLSPQRTVPHTMLQSLVGRLRDRVSTVRGSTAGCLNKIFQTVYQGITSSSEGQACTSIVTFLECEGPVILQDLRNRLEDPKSTVKRVTADAYCGLLLLGLSSEALSDISPDFDAIETIKCLSTDPSVTVRRTAADALTKLLGSVDDDTRLFDEVLSACSTAVVGLILENEANNVPKVAQILKEFVVDPILLHKEDFDWQRAWLFIGSLGNAGRDEAGYKNICQAIGRVLDHMVSSASVTLASISKCVWRQCMSTSELGSEATLMKNGAWFFFLALLGCLSRSEALRIVNKKDFEILASSWEQLVGDGDSLRSAESSFFKLHLYVLVEFVKRSFYPLCEKQLQNLHQNLCEFKFPPDAIDVVVSLLVHSGQAQMDELKWRTDLYSACEKVLASCVQSGQLVDGRLGRSVFTVGRIALVGFDLNDDEKVRRAKSTQKNGLVVVPPTLTVVNLVRTLLLQTVPGSSIQIPENIRSLAFLTIGKLCLLDESLAKDTVKILAREVSTGDSWNVQSNALVVFGDLCMQYTAMVDRYILSVARCLQAGHSSNSEQSDGAEHVREQAVFILGNLLTKDFIKWRGNLFQRFLVAAADDSEAVAQLAEQLLCGPLLTKTPRLFTNHFVESMFILNGCESHPLYMAVSASGGESASRSSDIFEGIVLKGEEGHYRRMFVYDLLISHMNDEDKIAVTGRITKEVLGSALDSSTALYKVCTTAGSYRQGNWSAEEESSANVLCDALSILSLPAMRLGKFTKAQREHEAAEVAPAEVRQKVTMARGRLLSIMSRKHLIEIILPIICNLKALLQRHRSSLLKNLMYFLVVVFQQYKKEVREALASDPLLLEELEFDAREFRKSRASLSGEMDESTLSNVSTP